jgi:hypothetical protein
MLCNKCLSSTNHWCHSVCAHVKLQCSSCLATARPVKTQRPGRCIGQRGATEYPPQSPDLTPLDFYLWGTLKDEVYRQKLHWTRYEKPSKRRVQPSHRTHWQHPRCLAAEGCHFEHIQCLSLRTRKVRINECSCKRLLPFLWSWTESCNVPEVQRAICFLCVHSEIECCSFITSYHGNETSFGKWWNWKVTDIRFWFGPLHRKWRHWLGLRRSRAATTITVGTTAWQEGCE